MSVFVTDSMPSYKASDLSSTVKKLYNYTIDLSDQLSWLLSNLDEENVPSLSGIQGQLEDSAGNISEIMQSTAGILARVESAEGNISTLTQTADGLSVRVQDAEGDLSSLVQTADVMQSKISSNEGEISTLTQSSNSLQSQITNVEGDVSSLLQTVDGFSLSVNNGEQSSTIKLLCNGVTIASSTIKFTGNVVFESDLADGTTEIDGGCIKTGTLSASVIEGGTLRVGDGSAYATLSIYADGSNRGGLVGDDDGVELFGNGEARLIASTHAKIEAQNGNVYIKADDDGEVAVYSQGRWVTI